ncbi:MAG: ATP-grasp domain-containing protein [Cyanobacteriota bacterium]|nr:ATP-grasp domain-containing protein [Cyanobacteriota bacterium]
MDLLEYQAKALFRQKGIPVLRSQTIDYPKDLKGLKIPYPVVLKSQVKAGGRGRAGGIKFVENTIDAVAAAQTIFNLPIKEEYPEVLLAEAKYDADQELYLAVFLDPIASRPILLGSQQGGNNIELTMKNMQQVVVEGEFSPFYARRLMVKMGLQGELIQSVSNIVEKMYQLFALKDLDLVEINPLGISSTGEVMALDGKVSVNDSALGRHQDLIALVNHKSQPEEKQQQTLWQQPTYQGIVPDFNCNGDGVEKKETISLQQELNSLKGNIGIICNGEGLTMATLDLVIQSKGKPANFLNLRLNDNREMPNTLSDRLIDSLDLVTQDKKVTVVLINIIGTIQPAEELAGAIAEYLQQLDPSNRKIEFVLRLMGSSLKIAKDKLNGLSVEIVENLDEAVSKAVSLAK